MRIVIANFKMNKTPQETKSYLMQFVPKAENSKKEIVLCMSATSLATAKYMLEGTNIKLGGQNLCDEERGKCTGEISGEMLQGAGADYVIVGHSERRTKFKESHRTNNKKIKIALKNRLKVILCVGESLAERNTLKMLDSLRLQIEESLKGLYENELEHIVIAYEPIWAISSGKLPTNKELEKAVKAIRKVICDDFSEKAGKEITVVYGGSLDDKNVSQYTKLPGLDGFLFGGASLDPIEFARILRKI